MQAVTRSTKHWQAEVKRTDIAAITADPLEDGSERDGEMETVVTGAGRSAATCLTACRAKRLGQGL